MMDRTQNTARMSYLKLDLFSQPQSGHVFENYLVLFEESMDTWVNSHDCYKFVSANQGEVRLIWSNEVSGFRHLYLMRFLLSVRTPYTGHVTQDVRQLTEGNWVVLDEGLFVFYKVIFE